MPVCSTCDTEIPADNRTNHVKGDWHIYNLKRVVANLPPIPEDVFNLKKQVFCEPSTQVEKKTYCSSCKTLFHNNRSFDAHLKSKKHIRNSNFRECSGSSPESDKAVPTKSDALHSELPSSKEQEEEEEPQPRALSLGSCLFCDRQLASNSIQDKSDTDKRCLAMRVFTHMSDVHNFVLPYPDKLVDPVGLLLELGRIVGEERACLSCGRQFYGRKAGDGAQSTTHRVALTAVRNHMLDKPGHLRLWCGEDDPVRVALLIAENEEKNPDTPPAVALAGGELFSQFYDQSVVAPAFLLPDSEEDVYEVRLPSGSVLGHRNMRMVYQQHLPFQTSEVTHVNQYALANSGRPSTAVIPSHIGPLSLSVQERAPVGARVAVRNREDARKAWELSVGVQGNLVNRSRLRRQY